MPSPPPTDDLSDVRKHINPSLREVRTLLERFTANIPITRIQHCVAGSRMLMHLSVESAHPAFAYNHAHSFISVLIKPGYVLDKTFNEDGHRRRLCKGGQYFHDEKYCSESDDLFNIVSYWFKAMGDDLRGLGAAYEELQGRNLFHNIVSLKTDNYIMFSPYNAIIASYYDTKSSLKTTDADIADALLELVLDELFCDSSSAGVSLVTYLSFLLTTTSPPARWVSSSCVCINPYHLPLSQVHLKLDLTYQAIINSSTSSGSATGSGLRPQRDTGSTSKSLRTSSRSASGAYGNRTTDL
ncbi:hypothetical protein NP233_g12054 [Leucocoprinus birnbaumii]|uniref:HAM1-like N-terminal domain-containing protein n=1 Tax=Leucocoprinus birnbaumii TaxID=56174 RepID=A0AAD5YQD1_9AGAR|nr:hypothetical protein NP233_g12054 [Leucocoprinus birnbaumii]